MTTAPHLRRAPIVEALIDVRVEARPSFRGEEFRAAVGLVTPSFPKVEERRGVTLELAFGAEEPTQSLRDHGLDGFFFRTPDGREIAQFRTDGFTLNRLAPYTSWEEILPKALALLDTYFSVAKPEAVSRIATRYINRLQFPADRLDDYLCGVPDGIPGIGGTRTGFSSSIVVVDSTGPQIRYSQGLESIDATGVGSVILDIDVMNSQRTTPQVASVASALHALHDIKNRVFFASIKDPAKQVFL